MATGQVDLWFNFVRAHRSLIREIERRLAAEQLPAYAWYDALWGIESGPQGMRRMHELADVMVIERYNLTRLVDRLAADDLVQRQRVEGDGRGYTVCITQKGKALRKRMWAVYEGAVNELFLSQFDSEQARLFAEALERARLSANAKP
ncbi:regulatory protein, MarR [Pseudomonas sp. M47T1]|uniref:MarR family winged helix-turn-helix transcriptional regulator n=1 Tax=Pseudomonas sp. M47T1 TaxID=1179778 RepID=UPI000260729C|nr:MarR family transcriptional regulator [Pseudomonas sp. M47T1]EIK95749.1 regulatory protein, MarR [Pseudomonas sp. M47T1]